MTEVPYLLSGDIGVVPKLKGTHTGDTLCAREQRVVLRGVDFPTPVISVAIEPDKEGEEEKIGNALSKLHEEDPTFVHAYNPELGQTIIRGMGGTGDAIDACAREMYREWGACHHFEMYDDVPEVLRVLAARGVRIGLISNSHRCMTSFQSHFELQGLVTAALSSSEHGYLKPHRSIFDAALRLVGV